MCELVDNWLAKCVDFDWISLPIRTNKQQSTRVNKNRALDIVRPVFSLVEIGAARCACESKTNASSNRSVNNVRNCTEKLAADSR